MHKVSKIPNIPESERLLLASWRSQLASRKVVCREASTEGSETAKSGTDEQKRYMRLFNVGKQAHLCNVQRTPKAFYSRYRRDWRKEKALTGGGLGLDSVLL